MRKFRLCAAIMATVMLFGCGKNDATDQSSVISDTKSGAKPVLALSSAEGKPGDTVEVTMSVTGADKLWCSSGIHISYDNTLTCVPSEKDPETPSYTKGAAVEEMVACVAKLWTEGLLPELEEKNKHSVFFCSVADADLGRDGDIATFRFVIPDDAQTGTVYDIEFFYREGDMFTNIASDEDVQEYAFSHWEHGSITVI